MILKYNGLFYTETEDYNIRKGDLISVDGFVGILMTEYDPDYIELVTETGAVYTITGSSELKNIKKVSRITPKSTPAFPYKKRRAELLSTNNYKNK